MTFVILMRTIFVALIMRTCCVGQDILFPREANLDLRVGASEPTTEPKPTESSKCAEHMLLYDGRCDCKPLYIYFPLNDSCHEAFRRGPCPDSHYVYMPLNESLPSCVENPCVMDGIVPFEDGCYPLGMKEGPCKGGALGVNETTFQLQCLDTSIGPHVIIDAPRKSCPKGSRRNNQGVCKVILLKIN
ncbi:uncharacterized protein LOC106637531 [Copidosoma floridanum]|uniref:uncharacterized protein LOC106637531 n=1 Tax=Copidosoma floridanum TaxID=29053 RepID=UPI0006C99639|nr:uncharacterized protein LOC106637531 [Copidosoma floridanum]